MRVLLHACCGPCLLEPYDDLAREHEVEVAYANPNIHPVEEYRRRLSALTAYTSEHGIVIRELEYEPARWERAVEGSRERPGRRCRACYTLRLTMVAEEAARSGFDAIATTLTVSPYQDADAVREAGERAAASSGVAYLHQDYRPRYSEAVRRSRELGMYRQNYCGCEPSRFEADAEREARRAERSARREIAQKARRG